MTLGGTSLHTAGGDACSTTHYSECRHNDGGEETQGDIDGMETKVEKKSKRGEIRNAFIYA